MHKRTLQLRLWPTLGAILGLSILVSLGTWQLNRYQYKLSLEQLQHHSAKLPALTLTNLEQLSPKTHNYRQVTVRGTFLNSYTVLFKHRQHDGHPGYWIATPLVLEGTQQALLVNRGWLPRERVALANEIAQAKATPETLTGLLHIPDRIIADSRTRAQLKAGQPLIQDAPRQWSSYDLSAIQEHLPAKGPKQPTILVLDAQHSGDPFPIASSEHLTKPYMTAERHLSYLIFWYSMAVVLLAFYGAYTLGFLKSVKPKQSA